MLFLYLCWGAQNYEDAKIPTVEGLDEDVTDEMIGQAKRKVGLS